MKRLGVSPLQSVSLTSYYGQRWRRSYLCVGEWFVVRPFHPRGRENRGRVGRLVAILGPGPCYSVGWVRFQDTLRCVVVKLRDLVPERSLIRGKSEVQDGFGD